MFPLLKTDRENPLHLFQIWLNLPKMQKFARPHYKMLWADMIPTVKVKDDHNNLTEIILIAGQIGDVKAPPPAPDSWAANPDNEVGIWLIKMAADAKWILPAASQPLNRTLYFFEGSSVRVAGSIISFNMAIDLLVDQDLILENGTREAQFLLLQGCPISEPVVQYGPFVMNTQAEIRQAFEDYRKDEFGGWPWDRPDQVHPRLVGKFAKYSDGREERR
jgi:redox-sensitive bicupin YhaK (pirin superfamily)